MAGRGHPRIWKTEKALIDDFRSYVEQCQENNKLANIAGFCVFKDIPKSTYYAQKEYYLDTIKRIDDIVEDYTINADINPTFKIFYMKNKCGYKDRQEIDNNVKVERSSVDELFQSIEEIKNNV